MQPEAESPNRDPKVPSPRGPDVPRAVTGQASELDETARKIVEQLQQDGRRSYSAIAEAVGLSDAAVRQRIKRLVDSGFIQIVAVTDPLRSGFARQGMVGIRTSGDTSVTAAELEGIAEIDYLVLTAGSFDILAEVLCEDDDHLLELVSRIRSLPQVVSTETFVYLKQAKQGYFHWGTR